MGPPIYIGGNTSSNNRSCMIFLGFNGATDLHRWKQDGADGHWHGGGDASMGPPIYIGGNSKEGGTSNGFHRSFNGATDLHRWKLFTGPT